jgi:hypothetical protein
MITVVPTAMPTADIRKGAMLRKLEFVLEIG